MSEVERKPADFVSRWSRRKAAARSADEKTEACRSRSTEGSAPGDSVSVQPPPADTPPSLETLPPIDTLNEDSDYSGFLSEGVGEELRKLALRKLFHLPKFNLRDGLDDYDEDYRSFEALGDVITADMRHHMERELERQREARLAENKVETQEPAGVEERVDGAVEAEVAEGKNEATPMAGVDEKGDTGEA